MWVIVLPPPVFTYSEKAEQWGCHYTVLREAESIEREFLTFGRISRCFAFLGRARAE
jgi:hypothetical protein